MVVISAGIKTHAVRSMGADEFRENGKLKDRRTDVEDTGRMEEEG